MRNERARKKGKRGVKIGSKVRALPISCVGFNLLDETKLGHLATHLD